MENKEKGKSNNDNKQEEKEKHLVIEGKKTTGETRYALHLKYPTGTNSGLGYRQGENINKEKRELIKIRYNCNIIFCDGYQKDESAETEPLEERLLKRQRMMKKSL